MYTICSMLTKKQKNLLLFINKKLRSSGVSPSYEEMKESLNLKSKSGIHRLISALEERGFIKRTDTADNGKIVVALIDEHEAMLKRIRKKGKVVALESANKNYETKIFGPDRVKVQGVLVSLYRNF